MKKLFLSLAVIASLCMASCGGSAEKAADQQATEVVDQINKASSEAEAQDIVSKAQAYVEKLVKEGKIQEAKDYLDKIKPTIEQKFPSTAPLLEKAQAAITAAAALTGDKTESVTDKAKDAASEAADSIASKTGQAVDAATDAATDAANKAKDAIKNALN
ncbi:MAG: hypothetical protein LUD17_10630 [Bacteroidales bacterium]|nr:hypothetical protein [Bacteroidales bacterium]